MSDQETNELKAGHPPAVKVAGMRVVQSKSHSFDKTTSPEPKSTEPIEDKEDGSGDDVDELPVSDDETKKPKLMLSGAPVKEKVDFPPEAIKSFHEKPVAMKQKHAAHVNVPNITQVHQPRSGNH